MLMSNPFGQVSAFLPVFFMKTYVVIMIALVVAGTIFDMFHKGSAKYFFRTWKKEKDKGTRPVNAGKMVSIILHTGFEALVSGELCSVRRRVAHLLTMYGFFAYLSSTVLMIFCYSTSAQTAPAFLPVIWYGGALSVCIGGYWFWFFIRVDVVAEGNSPFRFVRADLFVVLLIISVTLGLVWGYLSRVDEIWTRVLFVLYLLANALLFGSVAWSKFSHMFYKPAAAFQRRIAEADGSRSNLPGPADSPEVFGRVRQLPRQY